MPDGKGIGCAPCVSKGWEREVRKLAKVQPALAALAVMGGQPQVAIFKEGRRNGAMVLYPVASRPARSILTAKKAYPYTQERRKLGLQGSYDRGAVKVVDEGHVPGEKRRKG